MSEKVRIRIAEEEDFSKEVVSYLSDHAEVELKPCQQGELSQIFERYDVFWFRLGFRINESTFSENCRCKVIATPVTGIDHIDEEACRKHGIQIVCLRGEREFLKEVRATAELTLALTLSLMRHMGPAANDTLEGGWRRDLFRGNEIYKKTVGIIGLGRLGTITAGYFHSMGAHVIGYDVRPEVVTGFVEKRNSIEEVIQEADIVSIHVNLTPENDKLFDEAIFSHFDQKKWLVNTSRGGLIDETALLKALDEGRLAGAALDVIRDEHLFSEANPLVNYARTNRNLLLVPHIGGNTYESFEKTEWFIAKQILKALGI